MSVSSERLATEPEPVPALAVRSRQVVAGVCLLLVPLGWAAGELLAPESGSTAAAILDGYAEHRGAGVLVTALSLVTLCAFLPAFFGLVAPITQRGRRWGQAGLVALVYSTITIAVLQGVNVMFWAMTAPGADRGAMLRAVEELQHHPVALAVLAGHWVMGLGVVLVGIAVVRSRCYPAWTGYAIIGWFVVDLLAEPLGEVVAAIASNAFALAGLGAIGLAMIRRTRTTTSA
jgi:hypothetical protein